MESVKLLQEIVDKTVTVWTINQMFKGKVVEVEGDWLKIVTDNKKQTTYLLKADMITSITVSA